MLRKRLFRKRILFVKTDFSEQRELETQGSDVKCFEVSARIRILDDNISLSTLTLWNIVSFTKTLFLYPKKSRLASFLNVLHINL